MSEQQMIALVERVGETLEPDVGRLVAGGIARGRARRTRRRLATGAGVTAAVAVIAVAAPLLGSAGRGAGPSPSGIPDGMPRLAVAPADMSTTLAALLPGAEVVEDGEAYQLGIQRGVVSWHGVEVSVMVVSRALGIDRPTWQRCSEYAGEVCAPAPDGGRLWVSRRGELDVRSGQALETVDYARVYVTSGYVLEASAALDGEVDRALLRSIATDDVWWR
jgi:hypothetical protein